MEGLVLLLWLMCLFLGPYVAGQKGRLLSEGMLLALLFGPFGVLVECLLPTVELSVQDKAIRKRIEAIRHD